jgi:DNA-binding protein H-NS
MTTIKYETLMDQINELTKKAEFLRVLEEVQGKIEQYGITASDLGFELISKQKVVHTRRKPDARYKDPVTGATWTGRGKIPVWMKPALDNGVDKEAFAIS